MKRREARKGGQTLRVHPPGVDAGLSKSIRAVPRMLLTFTAAREQRLPVRSDQHVPPRGGPKRSKVPASGHLERPCVAHFSSVEHEPVRLPDDDVSNHFRME